jgi:hypothetical protein
MSKQSNPEIKEAASGASFYFREFFKQHRELLGHDADKQALESWCVRQSLEINSTNIEIAYLALERPLLIKPDCKAAATQ